MRQEIYLRYKAALNRLAHVLELEVPQLEALLGDISSAARIARRIKGFFGNPEIEEALDEVIKISLEYHGTGVNG